MNYKPRPTTIEFRTVSPVFIGSGDEIKPLSFLLDKNRVYVLDERLFFQGLSAEAQAGYLSWIDPIIEQMAGLDEQLAQARRARRRPEQSVKRQLRDQEERLSIAKFIQDRMPGVKAKQLVKVIDCVSYQAKTAAPLGQHGFRACLKDAQSRPYLPGTEIKGALRTALLFALLEAPDNYQILKQAVTSFKPLVDRNRPNYRQVQKEIPRIMNTVEARLLRGAKNDAKFDLLRLVRVGDSKALTAGDLCLEISKSVGTGRFTETVLETICEQVSGQFRLETLEGQPELLKQLGLQQRGQWISLAHLMGACYKRSAAILQAEQSYFERNGQPDLVRRAAELDKLNQPGSPLLRLGGGQGLLSITTDLWLRERDPELYETLREGISIQRKWRTRPGNFPKTRRVIWRSGRPEELLGWIQLSPPPGGEQLISPEKAGRVRPLEVPVPKPPSPPPVPKTATGRRKGRVKWFNAGKGYGFISPDEGGRDLFAHISEVTGPPLQADERVSFTVGRGEKGPVAQDVEREV